MTGQTGEAGWRRFVVYWGPVVGYAGLIFYLSAQSHPDEDLPSLLGNVNDKVLHALEYAGLGGLCYRAFRWGTSRSMATHALFFSILTASLYGVTDEVHQLFVPFRESSWQDWLADATGSGLGAVSYGCVSRFYFLQRLGQGIERS
ncbi:MAG: VanZ family protein [Nitrospirota bacterium]